MGAARKYYGLFNGGVNTCLPRHTERYKSILGPGKLQESMLGMTGTVNSLVRDNLAEGSSADEQLDKKARQVQPRDYIAGNKRVMSIDLTARKQQRLLQPEQPRAIECTV